MVVGLGISLVQAVTQIHEATLTFVPKLLAVGLVLALLGPWMHQNAVQFATKLLSSIGSLAR
jgi:flagellar biosynthetic protein FliQ